MASAEKTKLCENDLSTPKLMKRMESLYETSKWHDCVFKLYKSDGSGEELIFAHRLILATSSPVFESLCMGPMAEKNPVSIPDIDPLAFRMLLKFIYTDCVQFTTVETAFNILYASKKYLIYTLADLAVSYISCQIDESNCLKVYEFAQFVHEERLMEESWKYLCSHLDGVSKYFSNDNVSHDIIKNLVNEEALNGGEFLLFNICLLWAKSECEQRNMDATGDNLRKVLIEMNVLNKIRWLTFTEKELQEMRIYGILKNEELDFIKTAVNSINEIKVMYPELDNRKTTYNDVKKLDISQDPIALAIIKNELQECNMFPFSVSNIVEARKQIPLKRVFCHRFIESDKRPPRSALKYFIKACTLITVNKFAKLTGIFLNAKIFAIPQIFTLYNQQCPLRREYEEKANVTVTDKDNKVFFEVTNFSQTVKYGTPFKVPFDMPVCLVPYKEYRVHVELHNSAENYLFCVMNSISKLPCGLCVTFKEQMQLESTDTFIDSPEYCIISGLELYL